MKLGKNQCVKDNAVSEQTFTSASHESPDNIVSEKDASRAGVYGFAILMFALGFCSFSRLRCLSCRHTPCLHRP